MKYVQLIFSPTGGTLRTAKAVVSQWSESVETIDLCDPTQDFSQYVLDPLDLALIALPSYGGRVPALAAERLSQIRGNSARCALLCVYGNRAYEDTLIEMLDLAKNCGFTVAAAIAAIAEHSILHQYAAGRPDQKDVDKLCAYGKAILEKVNSQTPICEPQIPGSRPYKKFGGTGMVPKADKDCVGCGLCARQCPALAIDLQTVKKADADKCISCMRCVVKCPHSARKNNSAMMSAASLALKKACSVRKECELFL